MANARTHAYGVVMSLAGQPHVASTVGQAGPGAQRSGAEARSGRTSFAEGSDLSAPVAVAPSPGSRDLIERVNAMAILLARGGCTAHRRFGARGKMAGDAPPLVYSRRRPVARAVRGDGGAVGPGRASRRGPVDLHRRGTPLVGDVRQ